MNTVKHYLNLDLTWKSDIEACGCGRTKEDAFKNAVFLTRGDNMSHELVVSLREGKKPYIIADNCFVYMYGVSDGERRYLEKCEAFDNEIHVVINSGMLTHTNTAVEFSLVGPDGEILSTPLVNLISMGNDFHEKEGEVIGNNENYVLLLEALRKAEDSQITSVKIIDGDLLVSFANGCCVNTGRVMGEAFTYDDFTAEQLERLKGPKGDKGEKGDKGDTGASGVDGKDGADGADGKDGKSAYQYAKDGGFTGTEAQFAEKLAEDIPTKLPNPNALTINGISYDGSEAVDITVAGGTVTDGDVQIETVLSDNLFDSTTAMLNKTWYHGPSAPSLVDTGASFAAYVPLRGAGIYRTVLWWSNLSWELAQKVGIFKEDKSFLQYTTGTLTQIDSNFAYLEFMITDTMISNGAAMFGLSGMTTSEYYNQNRLMVVKNREYPSEYIPYGYIEVVVGGSGTSGGYNVLSGKTAVFLGDSICACTTTLPDAVEYGYGWGGLIGSDNNMKWKNFGKNGGTVTSISSVSSNLWLMSQESEALNEYPKADYVIFEGGCNDGDVLKEEGLGTISTDFSTFDTSTFSGAFEALILKFLTDFPNAKLGYIVAPKMGAWNTNFNSRIYVTYFERAKEICKKWGVPYIDLWNENPLNPCLSTHYDSSLSANEANTNGKFYTDGQHLTLAGYKRISPQIEGWMRGL